MGKKKTKTKTKVRSKSLTKEKSSKQRLKQKDETKHKRSHRAVAKILLDELMSASNTNCCQQKKAKTDRFRLSDLLKDGMLSSDEFMVEMEQSSDYYNYYYHLSSDRQIYQQFHKQFYNQFGNGRKLQQMQKTNA